MSSKALIILGTIVGSLVGGYIPTLFGADMFSFISIITSGLGSILGIYIAYKISQF